MHHAHGLLPIATRSRLTEGGQALRSPFTQMREHLRVEHRLGQYVLGVCRWLRGYRPGQWQDLFTNPIPRLLQGIDPRLQSLHIIRKPTMPTTTTKPKHEA